MNILLMSMPDCAPHFNAKRWKPPNLAISSIAGNIEGHNVYIADLILRRDQVAETVKELIAQYPSKNRDESRLLVLRKDTGKIEHRVFKDIIEYLHEWDLLVLNNT